MCPFVFCATDENENKYPFFVEEKENRLRLTLPKEKIARVKKLWALGEFTRAAAGEDGYYLQPRNIGMMGEFQTFFTERDDLVFSNEKTIMSLFGIKKKDVCALVRIERNYRYALETVVKDNIYTLCVRFDFTKHDKVYDDIRIEIVLLPLDAGYTEMAKAERELRLSRGEITLLSRKCEREAVEYAVKYPLIRIRMGWKPSPSPVRHQTPENEPDMFVACSFSRVRDIADELKRQGVVGAELQLVGWNIGGHDGRFPQLFPADPRLGGDEELERTIEYVKKKGYRISLHTNLIDAVEISNNFTWSDISVRADGQYHQEGHYSGGLAYRVCPHMQLKNNRRDLPHVADLKPNGIHFTDVISIVVPDDCHSPEHPCPTAVGIRTVQKIMHESRELMGAFSSEGTMDFSLGELDYGLYVSFGDGFSKSRIPVADRILPFFELTYHGIVLYNPISPTINYPIKQKRDRLIAIMRGGRPSLYFHSKFRTGGAINWMGDADLVTTTDEDLRYAVSIVKEALGEYQSVGLDAHQLVYMSDYRVLDSGIEVAVYEDGMSVVGNFGDKPETYGDTVIAPGEYTVIKA
ncbi:MAG: DUF5696 domain-containing protein [Eubacteriales bacterium]